MLGNIIETNYDFQPISKFIKLTGVTFENRQDLLPNLCVDSDVMLVRDRFNEYDKYAIRVVTEHMKQYVQIGWIPKDLAKILAPELDAGIIWKGKISKLIGMEYKNKGILIELECEDEAI